MIPSRPVFFPVAALAVFLCAPALVLAQSILLTAGDFAILGGTAITSTGVVGTNIANGNVGLSPGATTGITGFPPATITNGAIVATGPVTAQARLDLMTAAVGLAGMPSNANMSTVDLGGTTLAPGVYTFNGAASLSGALVLDAQGQNNVAWVFQIGTALTTAVNSSVTIINLGSNGGSDLGIFWNAGSAITIGANNQLAGNYLAGTSISFGGLTLGGGRALALAGISLDNNQVNARGGFGGGDWTGGLMYSLSGAVVPSLNPVTPGAPAGPVIVPPGTTTGGVGIISNNVTNNGILSPGFAPGVAGPGVTAGTLNVSGNFAQGPGGTLVIQLASPTAYDQLQVAGTAALAGTLQVDVANGFDPLGFSFPVLVAGGGVSGTFGTVNGTAFATNRAAIAGTVTYEANRVMVGFAQLPFAGFAQSANQAALARAAQASPALTLALNEIPRADQFPAALAALSPQGYAVWSEAAFAQGTALTDRLARFDTVLNPRDEFYFDASERRTRIDGNADVGGTTFTNSFGLVGGNVAINDTVTVGGFFSFGKMTAGLGSAGSSTTSKHKMPGVRVVWSHAGWYTEAVAAYGFDDYKSTRTVAFPGSAATASSATDGHQWLAGLTAGHRFTRGAVTLAPFVGVLANRWEADGFTETGAGAYNLTVAGQSARSLRSQVGAEVRLNRGFVQPHLRAAWLHEFSNDPRRIDAAFGAVNYAIVTREPQRDSGLFTAGLDFVFNPRALLYADVTAQTGGRVELLSAWRVGLAVSF